MLHHRGHIGFNMLGNISMYIEYMDSDCCMQKLQLIQTEPFSCNRRSPLQRL